MSKAYQKFGFGMVLVLVLSSCGVKGAPPAATPVAAAPDTSSLNSKALLEKTGALAKCENPIPLDKGPEGWKEVQAEALHADAAVVYQLAIHQAHAMVVSSDGHVASASVTTTVDQDEQGVTKEIVQDITCKDLKEGDRLEMPASPILAMNAATGQYDQRLRINFLLKPDLDKKAARAYDSKETKGLFNELEKLPHDRQVWQARGDDLNIKYYKSADGDIEMRVMEIVRGKNYSQYMIQHTAVRYLARSPKVK